MKGIALVLTLALAAGAGAQLKVGAGTRVMISLRATEAEHHAGAELSSILTKITGQSIGLVQRDAGPENTIYVGRRPESDQSSTLAPEEFAWKVEGTRFYIYGGSPRAVLYGVYRFLHEVCGVRWWTPWATTIPTNKKLVISKLDKREKPFFEARDPFWFHAFDGDWAVHNYSNSQSARLTAELGGKLTYQGFVHTFYELVPPSLFKDHPEWFSLIDGKRTTENAQLCTTDPALRDYVVERVRAWLKENPTANIVSVSQNDCFRPCQCFRCQELVKEQGSESAPVLALANYVAEKIEKDYPNVAIDTLAYQYTRHAPRTLKPRPNVIVRLCSIECNFAQPLDGPSNASFAADIKDWSRLTNRLYIWDYVTNFPHYVQPFPNYSVLGPNLRFFAANGVKGVFEEGAYQSCGAEMAEMRAWVLAQLMWDPSQDDRKLTDEFLKGYYGKAAKPIRQYLDLMTKAVAGVNMTIWSDTKSDYLGFPTMLKAEKLWQRAETAVKKEPEMLWRVKVGHLPVQMVWLSRWTEFRYQAMKQGTKWPLPESRKATADAWLAVATGPGYPGWSPLTYMNEGGQTPQQFVAPFATDPPDPKVYDLSGRKSKAAVPPDLSLPAGAKVVVGEDNLAWLWNEPTEAQLRPDPAALDGVACWMPGTHHEWAFQLPFVNMPKETRSGRWRVFVVVRVDKEGEPPLAFSAGVYDNTRPRAILSKQFGSADVSGDYKTFELGTIDTYHGYMVWVAPPGDPRVKAVWVDRIVLVKAADRLD